MPARKPRRERMPALFIGTFQRLATVPLGFDRDRVLIAQARMPGASIDRAARAALYDRLVEAAANVPGVSHAAASLWTPVGVGAGTLVQAGDRRLESPGQVAFNAVTPGWFATYGISIRAGRDLGQADTGHAAPVVLVNEAFCRTFLSSRMVVSEASTFPQGEDAVRRTIVGVAADAVYGSLPDSAPPTIFVPLAQAAGLEPPDSDISLSIRPSHGSRVALQRAVGAALAAVDRDLVVTVRSLDVDIAATLADGRLLALLSSFFGALALLLSGIGLYGLTAYTAHRRRTEIDIRMALGARRADIITLVVSRTLLATAVGLLLGLAGAYAATQYIETLLFGVTAWDSTTFLAVALTFVLVTNVAALVPALRAAMTHPAVLLRFQ